MTKFLIALGFTTALIGAAQAGDLHKQRSVKDEPAPVLAEPVAPSSFSWTGFYAGLNGGLFNGKFDLADPTTPDQKMRNWMGGAQAGFNYQMQSGIVVGVEADIDFGNLSDGVHDGNYITQSSDIGAFGTLRGRAGYAMGRVLPFVTGGLAFESATLGEICPAGVHYGHCASNAYNEKDKYFDTGWVYGAGVDYAVTDHLIIGAEYLHLDFGDDTHDLGPKASDRKVGQDADIIRGRIGYKF